MSLFAFLAQAGLSQLCLAPESNQCNLHIEGRIQLPLLPVILQPGSLVEIFLHGPDIDDNSYDESTLMQQPKPSRSPDLIPLRLLGLNYLNVLFYANQEEALMTQLRRSWPLPGNPVNLEAVHFVACPPTTLSSNQEHVYLLQQREDRFFQAHTNDVLILVTISFTAPDRSRIQKARVVWGPRRATRPQLLDFLRLGRFCDQPTTICWTYLNNHPWLDQATVTRRLEYGDHIRVQVRSDSVQWSDIEYAEDVSCSMRLFQDSPPAVDPPELQAAEEEEEEEGSEPLSRSRSRSRGRSSSRGDRRNSAAAGAESDDESLSLIQTGVQRRLRQQGLSSAVDPHVSDRWCEKQSEASPGCTLASDSDLHHGSVFASPLSHAGPAPKLICLDSSLSSLCPWRQSIATATFRSNEVAKLRDGLLSICSWPVEAFSNDWSAIPDAHEYVSLISSFQPSVAETGEYHIFLDGSFIPSTGVGAGLSPLCFEQLKVAISDGASLGRSSRIARVRFMPRPRLLLMCLIGWSQVLLTRSGRCSFTETRPLSDLEPTAPRALQKVWTALELWYANFTALPSPPCRRLALDTWKPTLGKLTTRWSTALQGLSQRKVGPLFAMSPMPCVGWMFTFFPGHGFWSKTTSLGLPRFLNLMIWLLDSVCPGSHNCQLTPFPINLKFVLAMPRRHLSSWNLELLMWDPL